MILIYGKDFFFVVHTYTLNTSFSISCIVCLSFLSCICHFSFIQYYEFIINYQFLLPDTSFFSHAFIKYIMGLLSLFLMIYLIVINLLCVSYTICSVYEHLYSYQNFILLVPYASCHVSHVRLPVHVAVPIAF